MDPTLLADLSKLGLGAGLGGLVIRWLVTEFKDLRTRWDQTTTAMQARCDDERQALSAEIGKVRDAHAKDQREVLMAATQALADVARSNRELVALHERREGSGPHPTRNG